VPLFDIVMASVEPREMGSASGVSQTVNALGMSLGIAGIGAIFFALVSRRGGPGGHVPTYLNAAQWTALATVGLLACSFAVAFGLPRRAREMGAPAGDGSQRSSSLRTRVLAATAAYPSNRHVRPSWAA